MPNEETHNSPSVTFRFRNIGPVVDAKLELGDLTIIAGRNNTGKTYLAYTLYGFLKMWKARHATDRITRRTERPPNKEPNFRRILDQLIREGKANFPIDEDTIQAHRADVIKTMARDFSKRAIQNVFSSQADDFMRASITVAYSDPSSGAARLPPAVFDLPDDSCLSVERDVDHIIMSLDRPNPRSLVRGGEYYLVRIYEAFLLHNAFPNPFILSAERFGISLFYRELDFTKNQLVDMLQKMGDDRNRRRVSPYFLIDRATSRYALPIKDNIDYTRSIPERRKDRSEFWDEKLFDEIKNMMDGYYSASSNDIRFISKARRKGQSFNIPLHLASSSARGLSDLYFFLRHVAKQKDLLIIDEPESHLDTANQIILARLLARFIRAGLKVLVTTHSDYLIKELNNLVMVSQEFRRKEALLRRLGYVTEDGLDPGTIRAYVAENGGLTQCEVDKFGIDIPVFDSTIDKINIVANELTSRLDRGGS